VDSIAVEKRGAFDCVGGTSTILDRSARKENTMNESNRPSDQAQRPAARDRGDIQQGYTGDEVPGFDPAVTPLKTDAEAAGTPLPASRDQERVAECFGSSPSHRNSSASGTAMRLFELEHNVLWPHLPLGAVALLVATVLVLAMLVSW
jgi:hypothetical protein